VPPAGVTADGSGVAAGATGAADVALADSDGLAASLGAAGCANTRPTEPSANTADVAATHTRPDVVFIAAALTVIPFHEIELRVLFFAPVLPTVLIVSLPLDRIISIHH
jgi:hypothetical protein